MLESRASKVITCLCVSSFSYDALLCFIKPSAKVLQWQITQHLFKIRAGGQYQKKQPNPKMGGRPKQTFLQRRYADCQQTHERTLNITNHQRNANQTTMRYHLTPVRMAIIKKTTGTSLVAQWLRLWLPMQGTWLRALVQEDPECRGATKPVRHNY